MNKLDKLRKRIEKGKFPSKFPEFGGANLIITVDPLRSHHDLDVMVYSEHAGALSWLVMELKKIYDEDIDYMNKYQFYPSIGETMNRTLTRPEYLFETMLSVVDMIEKDWGTK